ncbi:HAD-IA family hydrolase [Methylotenera sp. G11]|uniref:HAD-IA family hydrolase n=1 Tax=Methylotenera sp. G11 TaxID=1506585 RepID=UPI000645C720|nr:HAD-IA family hydrolase [Methylotenera sp. G11]
MVKQYDLIVWDWDGTLADSTGMITRAIIKAAEQAGLPPLTAQAASSIIGLGLRESIDTLYPGISDTQAKVLATQYNVNYFAGESDIPLFAGAADTIRALNRRGFKLAVATGKSRRGLNLALEHTQLRNFFHATRTVDECFSKPHPQMLDELMDDLVVLPERTLMIGDTSYDLQMAKNAGVQSIGVSYGAQSADAWQDLSPVQQFDDFNALSQWLLEYA